MASRPFWEPFFLNPISRRSKEPNAFAALIWLSSHCGIHEVLETARAGSIKPYAVTKCSRLEGAALVPFVALFGFALSQAINSFNSLACRQLPAFVIVLWVARFDRCHVDPRSARSLSKIAHSVRARYLISSSPYNDSLPINHQN
jgi:hypothetical protein